VKYALLLYGDPSRSAGMTPEQIAEARADVMPRWIALFEYLHEAAASVSGIELDEPEKAKTLRPGDGDWLVTDGPFAETKEQIGGVFFVECENLDEAIEMAARIPLAEHGSVEIRPIPQ
jgi:hypothetical protein